MDKNDGDLEKVGQEVQAEGKIEVAKAKLKAVRAKTKPEASNDDSEGSSDEGTDDEVKEKVERGKAADDARKGEFKEASKKAVEKNLKVAKPQHHAQHGKSGFKEQAARALNSAEKLGTTLQRQSSILKHADEALEGVQKIQAGISKELKAHQATDEDDEEQGRASGKSEKKAAESAESDSGSESDEEDVQSAQSGFSLDNSKKGGIDLNQIETGIGYEPEWGHNSGNSYSNGPTTHFYHGKASPYSVVAEDVQLASTLGAGAPPGSKTFLQSAPAHPGTPVRLAQGTVHPTKSAPAAPKLAALAQTGLDKVGITRDFLDANTKLFSIRGKVIQESAFLNSITNVPSVDSMLDDDENVDSFGKAMKLHYGI